MVKDFSRWLGFWRPRQPDAAKARFCSKLLCRGQNELISLFALLPLVKQARFENATVRGSGGSRPFTVSFMESFMLLLHSRSRLDDAKSVRLRSWRDGWAVSFTFEAWLSSDGLSLKAT